MMDHFLLVILFAIGVFILVLIVAFVYRYTFVFGSQFGSYTTPIWSNCSASSCDGTGKQQLVARCVPNPRTGVGCITETGEQSYADKVYEERECAAICPSTQEIVTEGECINGTKIVTRTCQTTGYGNGPQTCIPGTITTETATCPQQTYGSWAATYPETSFTEESNCYVGVERNVYALLAEGYVTNNPLQCYGSNCVPTGFTACNDPTVYANGYQYVSNCLYNNNVIVPNMCRLYPVSEIPPPLQPYIYRPFYFREERGYLSASGPNNLFYSQSRDQAILLYFVPRSSTRMIFLVGAFGNPYFLSFSEMILRPVSLQLGDGRMTSGLAPRYTVELSGTYMVVVGYAAGTIELLDQEVGFDWITRTA